VGAEEEEMRVVREFIPSVYLENFADKHGLVLHITERTVYRTPEERYFSYFEKCEVKVGNGLVGEFGDGCTPFHAVQDYARRISRKTLVYAAYTIERREIKVPDLVVDEEILQRSQMGKVKDESE